MLDMHGRGVLSTKCSLCLWGRGGRNVHYRKGDDMTTAGRQLSGAPINWDEMTSQIHNKWGDVLYKERHDHGLSCFYLVIYGDALNTSKEPAPYVFTAKRLKRFKWSHPAHALDRAWVGLRCNEASHETSAEYAARYDKWLARSRGTAEFVNYLEHRSNNRAAKMDFVADYVEQY